jgi:hypothetical protein
MSWWWHVRIYNKAGKYWHAQIATERNLREIDAIQDFYFTLTGCKMLLEGMSERESTDLISIQGAFEGIWGSPDAFISQENSGATK